MTVKSNIYPVQNLLTVDLLIALNNGKKENNPIINPIQNLNQLQLWQGLKLNNGNREISTPSVNAKNMETTKVTDIA